MSKLVAALVLWSLASIGWAGISPEDFARNPEILKARISPTGNHLAVLRIVDDKRVVGVLSHPGLMLTGVMSFPGDNQVLDFWWVNDDRIIASVTRDYGSTEYLNPTGELFGMDADGSRSRHLFGYRAGDGQAMSAAKKTTRRYAYASILHPIWEEPDQILVSISPMTTAKSRPVEAARMNVYNGKLSQRIRAPVSDASLAVDAEGEVRFAFSRNEDMEYVIHARSPDTGKWRLFSNTEWGESAVEPVAVLENGEVWVRTAPDEGPLGIYRMNPETQEMDLIYRHDYVDATALRDRHGNIWGVHIEPNLPKTITIDPEHPLSVLNAELGEVFPGRYLSIANQTHDGRFTLARTHDDNSTPELYLYDAKERQLAPLFDYMPWIDDGLLAETQPIELTARDGLTLHGYLTLPTPAASAENLPLVLMPHGGPHGPRDSWGYDRYVQVLATHGYAVLQVNFRGSGGYGPHFEKLGYLEWDGKMQDDLTDTTRWAIEQGIADPERICIHGWSYGGYATLMSVVREPNLYACAVAAAGVYDHDIQYRKADFIRWTRWGDDYIDKVIGPTAEDRREASPITYLDRLKTPLLIVHGENDQRVPVEHARALRKALQNRGIDAEYMEKKNEGHGFFKEQNRTDFFHALLNFLDRHIGTMEEVAAAGR